MEKNGYILIKNEYITWFSVAQILSDDKVLLRSENFEILWFRRGPFKRFEGAEVSTLFFDITLNEPQTMKFFPDDCRKRTPPKVYFWKVYSILKPELYRHLIDAAFQKAHGANQLPDKIILTNEIARIFHSFDNSKSLTYARKLKSW